MLTRLYNWTMDLAAQPHALWALALVAFAESSVFPIPPDVMLIPTGIPHMEPSQPVECGSKPLDVQFAFE